VIKKGDWVRVLRGGEFRGRIGELIWIFGESADLTEFQVVLFGDPRYVGMYIGMEIQKLNEMEVLAEAARGL